LYLVEALLNNTQLSINVYSGQLDLVVATKGKKKKLNILCLLLLESFISHNCIHFHTIIFKFYESIYNEKHLIIGTLQWVQDLRWPGAKRWSQAKRYPILVHDIVHGYRKTFKNFAFYWISRAGHMVRT
jgi:hypothetical protein